MRKGSLKIFPRGITRLLTPLVEGNSTKENKTKAMICKKDTLLKPSIDCHSNTTGRHSLLLSSVPRVFLLFLGNITDGITIPRQLACNTAMTTGICRISILINDHIMPVLSSSFSSSSAISS